MRTRVSFVRFRRISPISVRPRRLRLTLLAAAALSAVLVPGPTARAGGAVSVATEYQLTIGGFLLAEFTFSGDFDGRGYVLSGRGDSSRLVSLVTRFTGHGKSAGAISSAAVEPASYEMRFMADNDTERVDMRFRDGAIDQVAADPPLKASSWRVPVEPTHRVGVIDPLSALLLPLPEGRIDDKSACDRRLPIFDGRYRYDLVLTPKRAETIRSAGDLKGPTRIFVCKIKYMPIAGHRPQKQRTRYWQESEDMEIWLAPAVGAGLFIPYRVIMPARVGTLVLSLSGLRISNLRQQAAVAPVK